MTNYLDRIIDRTGTPDQLLALVQNYTHHLVLDEQTETQLLWLYKVGIVQNGNMHVREQEQYDYYQQLIQAISRNPQLLAHLQAKKLEEDAREHTRSLVASALRIGEQGASIEATVRNIDEIKTQQRAMKLVLMQHFGAGSLNADQLNRLALLEYEPDNELMLLAMPHGDARVGVLKPHSPKGVAAKLEAFRAYLKDSKYTQQHDLIRHKIAQLEQAQYELSTPNLKAWVDYFHKAYFALEKEVRTLQSQVTRTQADMRRQVETLAAITRSPGSAL